MIEQVLKRSNFQQIAHFIVNGSNKNEFDSRNYDTRINEALNGLEAELLTILKDEAVMNTVWEHITDAMSQQEEIYFELGSRIGMYLTEELINK